MEGIAIELADTSILSANEALLNEGMPGYVAFNGREFRVGEAARQLIRRHPQRVWGQLASCSFRRSRRRFRHLWLQCTLQPVLSKPESAICEDKVETQLLMLSAKV